VTGAPSLPLFPPFVIDKAKPLFSRPLNPISASDFSLSNGPCPRPRCSKEGDEAGDRHYVAPKSCPFQDSSFHEGHHRRPSPPATTRPMMKIHLARCDLQGPSAEALPPGQCYGKSPLLPLLNFNRYVHLGLLRYRALPLTFFLTPLEPGVVFRVSRSFPSIGSPASQASTVITQS